MRPVQHRAKTVNKCVGIHTCVQLDGVGAGLSRDVGVTQENPSLYYEQ